MIDLQPGDPAEVGGFAIEGRLGAGGMGVVLRGRSADGTPVAVKIVRPEFADDPEFRARFRRELKAVRAVGGTCTAKLLAGDADAPVPWLAVEFVPGPTLARAVADRGPLPAGVAHALAVGLAEALVAIHAAGVVHRDLKPANVILGPHGPRVVDFGIAAVAAATAATRTGAVIGSLGYMSPEQITGGRTGPATDVFSWALTVAFAAAGRPPYGRADRPEAMLYRVVHGAPDLTGLPAAVDGPVRAALVADPAARPSAEALLRLLLPDAAHPLPAATTLLREAWPGSPVLRRTRPAPRRRVAAAAVAVTLLTAGAGVGWALVTSSPPGSGSAAGAPPSGATGAPPTTTAAASPTTTAAPAFDGEIGTAAGGRALADFLGEHDGQVVRLDVARQAEANVDPPDAEGNQYLTLEDECETGVVRPPGGCGGVQLVLVGVGPDTDSLYGYDSGFVTLRGRFAVTLLPGIQMGYVSTRLRAVPATEAG